ncbi:MAG: nucleoside monophosphate kinase [Planctomycetota bacterium]|nr:MAG: nucleoside monophosphate kinase [Planctomycetota bacterium]
MANPYRCVLLFGPPGAGKGTQGERLGALQHCVHLATGDMFRGLDKDSELGRRVAGYSSRGELVPDDVTIELFLEHVEGLVALGGYDPTRDVLLLDGIPRSLGQAQALDGKIEPLAILHLVVSDMDAMVARMKGRAETQGRADDADEDVIRNRFNVYDAQTAPVLGHYDAGLVRDVDAQQSIEEVFAATRTVIDELLATS